MAFDDKKIRELLAIEVGGRCSAPYCQAFTGLPQASVHGIPNSGDAAHIKGDKPLAARFDPHQSEEARNSSANGIWLCPHCHRKIDRYRDAYTADLLHDWKARAIDRERARQQGGHAYTGSFILENELDRIKSFLDEIFAIYSDAWMLLREGQDRPGWASRLQIPSNLCSKIGYWGISFRTNDWSINSRYWSHAPEFWQMQNELLRLLNVMARDPRLNAMPGESIVDLTFDRQCVRYIDSFAQAMQAFVEYFDDVRRNISQPRWAGPRY